MYSKKVYEWNPPFFDKRKVIDYFVAPKHISDFMKAIIGAVFLNKISFKDVYTFLIEIKMALNIQKIETILNIEKKNQSSEYFLIKNVIVY